MAHRAPRLLLLGTALLLEACQAAPGTWRPYSPSFRLAAGEAAAPATAGEVVVRGAGGDRPVVPGHTGVLTVRFDQLLPPKAERRLLATLADVAKVTIRLQGAGVDHTETILRAAIVDGATSFTFTGLPPGALTVTIKALDAADAAIGLDVRQATVTAGQTTVVASTVLLTPTAPPPQVIVGGGSGGSGGGTGTLAVGVTLVDDKPVVTPALVARHRPGDPDYGVPPWQVTLDGQGTAWFTGGHSYPDAGALPAGSTGGAIARITPADALTIVPVADTVPLGLATNPDGTRIFMARAAEPDPGGTAPLTLAITTAGARDRTAPATLHGEGIAVAPDGTAYLTPGSGAMDGGVIRKVAPDGTLSVFEDDPYFTVMGPTSIHGGPSAVACDATGHVVSAWLVVQQSNGSIGHTFHVRRTAPDGTHVFDRTYLHEGADFPQWVNAVAVDAQGDTWVPVPSRQTLERLSPTGALVGTYPLAVPCDAVHVDPAGRIWAYAMRGNGQKEFVVRLSAQGEVVAYYHLGGARDRVDLAVSADDHLWVVDTVNGLLHYRLDPLP